MQKQATVFIAINTGSNFLEEGGIFQFPGLFKKIKKGRIPT